MIEREIYTLSWLIPQRVIWLRYNKTETLTAEILEQLGADIEAISADGQSPLHLVSDNTKQGNPEAKISTMRDAFNIFSDGRWGYVMVIGIDRLTSFFANIVSGMLNINLEKVNSVDEALKRLYKLDTTLPHIED